MFMHLNQYDDFKHITELYAIPDLREGNDVKIDKRSHISEAVKNNSKVMKSSRDWLELCFLESFMIKKHHSAINKGIKAAKELQLF